MRSRYGSSSITLPDETTFYHFVKNRTSNTEVYIGNIEEKLFVAWRGTQFTAEDGLDFGDIKQDLKVLPGKHLFKVVLTLNLLRKINGFDSRGLWLIFIFMFLQ